MIALMTWVEFPRSKNIYNDIIVCTQYIKNVLARKIDLKSASKLWALRIKLAFLNNPHNPY